MIKPTHVHGFEHLALREYTVFVVLFQWQMTWSQVSSTMPAIKEREKTMSSTVHNLIIKWLKLFVL